VLYTSFLEFLSVILGQVWTKNWGKVGVDWGRQIRIEELTPIGSIMHCNTSTGKAAKGSVQMKVSNGRLQLVFSHGGRRHYLSLGLPDNPASRKVAEAKAKLIESDIVFDRFDSTLAKYKSQSALSTITPTFTPIDRVPEDKLPLKDLWEKYTQYKSNHVAPSTLVRDYGKIAKRLTTMPKELKDEIAIRDWLLKQFSSEVARRTLVQLNACCKWAVKSGYLAENPFEGMAGEIKKTVRGTSRQAFSKEERDAILAAFENNTYSSKYAPIPHSYYLLYVRFLFLTGARPEEAIALKWKHISPDNKRIQFREARPSDTGVLGETKTGKVRTFPCNGSLTTLLESIRPEGVSSETLVFPSPRGDYMDSHNFSNRIWKPVVEALVEDGKVEHYLPQYNTRHTAITLLLDAGLDAKDVARLVGNSPEIIYKHYAGNKRDLIVPEI
jgi:integrase